ncbi:MAG: molybdenum cofactor biosynthesis protein MoaE [Gammaproteobacteria bacterium]
MQIEIRTGPFDPLAEVQRHRCERLGMGTEHGATAIFIGTMRDFNEDQRVQAMTVEHYPGMSERHLQQIAQQASTRWPIGDLMILHRVGVLQPGDPIVLVAVWSAHRAAAFDACRFLIEDLKSRAPFWKKEVLAQGERWVETNTAG